MTRYLVDNSVWQRLPRSEIVREAITALLDAEDELCCCALSLDEFAYSARSAADHAGPRPGCVRRFCFCRPRRRQTRWRQKYAPSVNAGKGRSAGVVDVAIAAVAAVAGAVVLHYDADFDHIAEVEPTVRARWVVPRGSID